jgi:hypothetical protein
MCYLTSKTVPSIFAVMKVENPVLLEELFYLE